MGSRNLGRGSYGSDRSPLWKFYYLIHCINDCSSVNSLLISSNLHSLMRSQGGTRGPNHSLDHPIHAIIIAISCGLVILTSIWTLPSTFDWRTWFGPQKWIHGSVFGSTPPHPASKLPAYVPNGKNNLMVTISDTVNHSAWKLCDIDIQATDDRIALWRETCDLFAVISKGLSCECIAVRDLFTLSRWVCK